MWWLQGVHPIAGPVTSIGQRLHNAREDAHEEFWQGLRRAARGLAGLYPSQGKDGRAESILFWLDLTSSRARLLWVCRVREDLRRR